MQSSEQARLDDQQPPARAFLFSIAAGITLIHLLTNGRYGFHRDEWQFLSDARHLDWGFVSYPPLTPFVERVSLEIFGLSMVGLRLFSVLAQAAAIVVTGLMAKELGGGRLAQVAAALAVALSPLPLFEGTEFQYTTFDYLWWVLIAYFTIRLVRTETPRWWMAIGATVGLGLLTKYAIVFYIVGLLAGLVFTGARRYILNRWFWAGIAVALLIFLPNFLWLVRHNFISYDFLHSIHVRDVRQGRADGFFPAQIRICVNLVAAPVCLIGLYGYLRGNRYRMLSWMYLVPLFIFFFAKGRGYYVAGLYPMLLAMGSTLGERWLARLPKIGRRAVEAIYFAGLAAVGAYIFAVILPIQSSGPLRDFALDKNGDLREEIGWPELVKTVAGIRDSLPADQQANLGIVVGNYGEQGSIELLGPAYHLPPPISLTNSAWLRGYPTPQPSTLIVVGVGSDWIDRIFTGCRLAGRDGNSEGIKNEESQDHPNIYVCGSPRLPWPEFWKKYQSYG
jgi:hypothetical protein